MQNCVCFAFVKMTSVLRSFGTAITVNISGVQSTINGPVEISGVVSVSGQTGQSALVPTHVSFARPMEISGTIGNEQNPSYVTFPQAARDAFGRFRMSQPQTLFDYNSVIGKDDLHMNEMQTGSGEVVETVSSQISLNVYHNNDTAVQQSKEYIPYQPGKSKLHQITGVLTESVAASKSNVISRIGSFDLSSGHYFMQSNGGYYIGERAYGSDNVIARSNWLDPLDGTGSSGLTLDFTKAQIFCHDVEWLGVGQVRMGIVVNGGFINCQHFNHNESNAVTYPYMRMAKLPIRWEINSTGHANNLRAICTSVQSEGGFVPLGHTQSQFPRSVYVVPNSTTFAPVFSIKLRPDTAMFPYSRTTLKLREINILAASTNDYGAWCLVLNPTFGNESTSFYVHDVSHGGSAMTRHHANSETMTGGHPIRHGFQESRATVSLGTTTDDVIRNQPVATSLSGHSDILTLGMNRIVGSSPSNWYTVKWDEYF